VTAFQSALELFFHGELSYEALADSLDQFLRSQPAAAQDVELQLEELFRQGRLPKQVYDALVGMVRPDDSPRAPARESPQPLLATETTQKRPFAPISKTQEVRAAVGATIRDRFVLKEELGRGGMGIVFKALDLRRQEARDSDPYVALKILNDDIKDVPEAFVILQREAKKAQALAHPNIGTVYDFDRDGDIVYMCMEFLDGESVEQLIKRLAPNCLSIEDARSIILGMVRGLAHAHSSGILHADFKPGNVFVTRKGDAKILDFGIARAVSLPGQTVKETVFNPALWDAFTPSYASCEMIDGLPPDPRDDIYGLACVTYALLSGRHPFDRKPANQARASGMTPPPVAGLSRDQNAALARGLAFKRSDRLPNAELFASELLGRGNAGRRLPLLAGAGAAIIAVAILAWFLWPQDNDPSSNTPEPAPPVVLDAAAQKRIDSLLRTAEAHLSVGRLVEPTDSSALVVFHAVLELEPTNAVARAGLQRIAERMEAIARERLAAGDMAGAEKAVSQGLEAVPDSSSLLRLQGEL
jgi:serine/threonine protein kinase